MQDTTEPQLERVPDLWFDNARTVFQAERKIFRVSGGPLAAVSHVFGDMLGFPHPDLPEMFGHCPLILLSDIASDVTHFFKAILDPKYEPSFYDIRFVPTLACLLRHRQALQARTSAHRLQDTPRHSSHCT